MPCQKANTSHNRKIKKEKLKSQSEGDLAGILGKHIQGEKSKGPQSHMHANKKKKKRSDD